MVSPYIYPDLANQKRCAGIYKPRYGEKIEYIETLVTSHFGLTIEGIKKKDRHQEKVLCRNVCYYLIHKTTPETFLNIGQRFGGRDHTTVIHGLNTLRDLMETDPEILKTVQFLEGEMDLRM